MPTTVEADEDDPYGFAALIARIEADQAKARGRTGGDEARTIAENEKK